MAILPMKRIHIYALLKDRKSILELLQRFGAVQLADLEEDELFIKNDITDSKMQTERDLALAEEALAILASHVPEQTSILDSLKGKREISLDVYEEMGSKSKEIRNTAERIQNLDKHIAECTAEMHKLQVQMDTLAPWSRMDIPLQFQGTRSSSALIGTLPGEVSLEEILAKLADLIPEVEAVHVDIISGNKDQTNIFVLCGRHDTAAVEGALRTMGFARPSASASNLPPAKQKAELEAEYKSLVQQREEAKSEIMSCSDQRDQLKFLIDWLHMKLERLETSSYLLESKRTFIITGYIPKREADGVVSALQSRFLVHLELEDPDEDEEVPVLLKNNKFVESVDGVLRSFSYPGKGEIDPSSVMSVFYYILFGLMLSDAAYGLIITIVCGLCLWKFPNMESSMRKSLRMFFFCGLSTTFWGALFGSWFGDLVTVVSTTFFNKTVTIPPLWFEPIKDPMRMLVFSMAMGVVHLFAGLALKIVQCVKEKQYKDALYDAILWYLLVGGLLVLGLSSQQLIDILNLDFILPANIGRIGGIAASAAAIGVVLTAGRESKNWFKRILKGLYGLYNVTGYLSDILSYSRLLALGLATGVIATVINQMGSMGGRGIGSAILFIVVFVVGHAINIGINLLGAYVHTNRLSFVEFFGKFYEGGGSEFAPFGVHTKYYKLKEETNNG
jgi:V/A-type H+-transporting ATPase subunit I